LAANQLRSLANCEVLKSWDEADWVDVIVAPMVKSSHLFDLANHLPTAQDVFVYQNYFIVYDSCSSFASRKGKCINFDIQ